jgi:hypothetical protein
MGIDKNIDLTEMDKTLKNMALGREVRSFEFQDGSDVWEALPNGLRELIEEHNCQPKELQADFRATSVKNPQIQQLISQGIMAIEQCEELDLDL